MPPTQIRGILTAARRAGVEFSDAWPAALEQVDDDAWAEALSQTAGGWARAYMLEPATAGDLAVDLLSRGLAGELADLDAAGHCAICDAPLVLVPRSGTKRFCSHRCKRVADARRELDVAVYSVFATR